MAAEREALFAIVECRAPEELLVARLSKPSRQITDGRIELLDEQRAVYEVPTSDEAELLVQIDTSGALERASSRVYESLFS
jgi:hypothetical protein